MSIAAILQVLVVGACGEEGSGNVVSSTREVSGFQHISVDGIGDVLIEQTESESLTVTTDDNFQDNVEVEVTDGTLTIEMDNIVNPSELRVRIEVDDLDRLRVAGLMNVNLLGIDTDNLDVTLTDSSEVRGNGTIGHLDIDADDTAEFRGTEIETKSAIVSAADVSDVTVDVGGPLSVTTDDIADVTYIGNPELDVDTSGGGSVEPADEQS